MPLLATRLTAQVGIGSIGYRSSIPTSASSMRRISRPNAIGRISPTISVPSASVSLRALFDFRNCKFLIAFFQNENQVRLSMWCVKSQAMLNTT